MRRFHHQRVARGNGEPVYGRLTSCGGRKYAGHSPPHPSSRCAPYPVPSQSPIAPAHPRHSLAYLSEAGAHVWDSRHPRWANSAWPCPRAALPAQKQRSDPQGPCPHDCPGEAPARETPSDPAGGYQHTPTVQPSHLGFRPSGPNTSRQGSTQINSAALPPRLPDQPSFP